MQQSFIFAAQQPPRSNHTVSERASFFNALKRSFLVLGLIFVTFGAKAQTECLESTPPRFDPEHDQTLCQKYNSPVQFPNIFGTTKTRYASQIIWDFNNGSDVFTGDIDLIGDLIIDQNFTLLNCKVRISPNVRIRS